MAIISRSRNILPSITDFVSGLFLLIQALLRLLLAFLSTRLLHLDCLFLLLVHVLVRHLLVAVRRLEAAVSEDCCVHFDELPSNQEPTHSDKHQQAD